MLKLRILHCLRAPVGGLFRHVRDLVQEQVAAGHDVAVICDSTAMWVRKKGVETVTVGLVRSR